MAEYIRALEPVVSPKQLERTKNIIKEFTKPDGLGIQLHQYLLDKRETEDNWVNYVYISEYVNNHFKFTT